MMRVPVRDSVAELAATEYATVPGPLPLLPAVIVIHDASAVAFQAHVAGAVTVTVPDPPSDAKDILAGAMVNEQTGVGSIGEWSPPQLALPTQAIAKTRRDGKHPALIRHLPPV
jgi:hypothetical protein